MKQTTINNIQDLLDYFGADTPDSLNHRIYKDTACGASISIYLNTGEEYHNGDNWPEAEEIEAKGLKGFTIQTIVEGSDATVDSDLFTLPVQEQAVTDWIKHMEAEADYLWQEANEEEGEEDEDEADLKYFRD